MDFNESMSYIEELKKIGFILGLDNIKNLMREMGNPDKNLKFVHIAGTNGKGSTATYINNILSSAGFKTGLYTSPSIIRFNERFKIDNEDISSDRIAEILTEIKEISENAGIKITAFEAETALAIKYFSDEKCDFVVLEVGLGGRLDATNFIEKSEVSVITNIGLDHIDFLGSTLEEIAGEKAGIIKDGGHVVSYQQEMPVEKTIRDRCNALSADVKFLKLEDVDIINSDIDGQEFKFMEYDIKIRMLGDYQPYNAALALMAVEELKNLGYDISDDAIIKGFLDSKIFGRFQVLSKSPYIIVDGAHNYQGVKSLVSTLEKYFAEKEIIFVYGTLRDKDYIKSIEMTLPISKIYYTVRPDNDRALSSIDLKNEIINRGGRAIALGITPAALRVAIENAGPDDCIVCFGSLYQVGEVINFFEGLADIPIQGDLKE
ncbi:MAG: folylpolyglutamate synthase/dihydrofolate synthase family protein [Tissierellia bacterium]|nr:folylpolyglutamate synthase/dihydrofolate synthase family protein [Tissierellia bacterium]